MALATALDTLMNDEAGRKSIGAAAQAFAKREFRANRYAREILDFAWDAHGAQHLLHLADRVAAELTRMGVTADMPVVDRVSAVCEDLFSGRRSRPSRR